jgi:hypothetical protein
VVLIEFEWCRDISQSGWELHSGELPLTATANQFSPFGEAGTHTAHTTMYLTPARPQRIVRCGGDLQLYQPLKIFKDGRLAFDFAEVQSPEDLLGFVKKFGPLTTEGRNPALGDNVEHVRWHAGQMRELIRAYCTGRNKTIAGILGPKGMPLSESAAADVQVRLVFDAATKKPTVQLVPRNLLNAIWIQLAEYLADTPDLALCEYCGEPFARGPGRRRGGAKFCTEQHKIDFHSRERSRPSGQRPRRG